MQMRLMRLPLAVVIATSLTLVGCQRFAELKAKKSFKDANNLYTAQAYDRAAAKYEEVISSDPNMTTAYFYLANSYDLLYKPELRGEPENDAYLQKAIENYRLAVDKEQDPQMRKLALQYLVAAYGPDKLDDPAQSEPVLHRMIEMDPSDTSSYFALAKVFEDDFRYDEAEAILLKAREAKPDDGMVYTQLAGYYNRQGEFDKTIEALEQRAAKEPNNPEAFYTIATFYWDKAYRDFSLRDPQKRDYLIKGQEAINKALQIKDDYLEAVTYKGLLLRLQANMEKDQNRQQALLKEADALEARANELQKKRAAGTD